MARKLLWPFGSAVMLVAFAIAFSLALPSAGALQNDPNATPTEGDDSTTDNNFNTSNDNSGTTSDGNGNSNSDDNTDTTNNDSNTNNDSIDNSNPDDNTDTSNDDSGTGNDGNVSPDNDTDTSTDSATPPVTPTDTIDIEIPVTETGSLNLSIIYLDQPLSNQGASCSLTAVLTNVDGDVEASGGFDSCGDHHVFRDVPVGDYQLRLLYDGHLILPEVSITINADQSTSHTFDISEVVGIVVGIVTINGQPLTNGQYLVCGMTTGQTCQMPNPDGHFRLLLPTGTGTGLINDGSNSQLDTFDFTVTAGQATEIGTFDIKTEVEVTGSLDVSFSYLGQPLSEHGAACQISAVLTTVDGNFVTRGGFDGCDGNGPLHFTNIPVGEYQLGLFYDLDVLLPEVSITIAVDQTSSHTFEISSVVGIVTGTATINGQPPEGGQHFRICGETSSSVCQSTDAVGHFRLLLPAGSGTVRLSEASELDTFSFTVTAGQTTEVGTINFEVEVEQTGEIEALFEYLDQPLSKYGAACQLGVKITAIEGDFQRTNEFDSGGSGGCSGRMLFTNIPVGDYRLDLFYGNSDEYLLPEIQVNVSADHVTSHTFDISVVVGVVAGTITVNGQAPEQGRFTVCGSTTGQACQTVDTNGRFALLLPPGNGIGSIEEGSGFGFTVTAGQTTGTFMTEIDPAEYFVSGVPQGTEVCIANEDFSSCQPFESSRARFTSTVRAFAQPKPASILVIFENVPAGAYQITLRVPGGDTYVVGNTSFGIDSAPTDTDALNLTFIPCETRACESPHSTKVDGATATWTIDSLDDSTDESTTSTATLSDGIANTTTDPLPLGTYRVCLDPTLTGGSSGDVRIAEEAICEQVEITEENATSSISVSFEQKLTDRSDSESENGQTHNTIRQLVQFLVFLLALLFSF